MYHGVTILQHYIYVYTLLFHRTKCKNSQERYVYVIASVSFTLYLLSFVLYPIICDKFLIHGPVLSMRYYSTDD